MGDWLKIKVFIAQSYTGPLEETFEGDDLNVLRDGSDDNPLLKIREGSEALGEFQRWQYWIREGAKGDLTKTLREIMNLVLSSNPDSEKLHFIGKALHEIDLLAEGSIPPRKHIACPHP